MTDGVVPLALMPDTLAPTSPAADPLPSASIPAASPAAAVTHIQERPAVLRWFWATAGLLLAAYLLLQNPYWVPGGDSDFYVSIARSMARAAPTWRHPFAGFLYNGLPVQISPPGWPWVMAQVMKLTPTFLALKLTTLLTMWGALLIGYFIALRFLRPAAAAGATLLAGLLMPVYSLTYFLHSEGVYCLIAAAALLLALRLREGRGGVAHRVVLVALCVGLPMVRWAGVLQLLPIVAVLLSGPRTFTLAGRHWRTALACALVIVGTFVAARHALKLSPAEAALVQEDGTGNGNESEDINDTTKSETGTVPLISGPNDVKKGLVREYADRLGQSGKWFAWLLWQPTRFVEFNKPAAVAVDLLGWSVIALLAYLAVDDALRGEYLWLSLACYTGGICLLWNNVNSRYFVPVAPLLIVGLLLAIRRLALRFPAGSVDAWKWVRRALVYSLLLCNLAMFLVDVIVMRSDRFYATFEAGQHKDLIAASKFLMALPPAPDKVAPTTQALAVVYRPVDGAVLVNERYENLGKIKSSKAGSRAMVLLADRFIKPLDGRVTRVVRPDVQSPKLARLMRQKHAEWYLAQAPSVPWRLWHFKVPDWLQRRFVKNADQPTSGGWVLYHFNRKDWSFTPYDFDAVEDWPTRVPGL